jgi:phosphoglycerate dehydrogenase-like enzyme
MRSRVANAIHCAATGRTGFHVRASIIRKVTDQDFTLLVVGNPGDPRLAMLAGMSGTRIVAGDRPEDFAEAAPTAAAMLSWMAPRDLLERVFAMAPNLRWLHSASAGLENVLFPALVESAVTVTNARGVFSDSLAEFVLAAMLFFAKDLRRMVRSQTADKWDQFDVEMLEGKALGIAGYGSIGRACAARAHGFGMRVFALRRRPELCSRDPLVEQAFPKERLHDMIRASDYVVTALPLTDATRGLIGARELAAMKPTAVLINVGRGPVLDESALINALDQRRIRGAALDVFNEEPLAAGHPFYRLENVLLSPHCADHIAGWLEQSMEMFLRNVERFRKGEPLENVVDKRLGY